MVFYENEEQHFEHLEHVLLLLDKAEMKLKLTKCVFFQDKIDYLGHIISPGRLSVSKYVKAT